MCSRFNVRGTAFAAVLCDNLLGRVRRSLERAVMTGDLLAAFVSTAGKDRA